MARRVSMVETDDTEHAFHHALLAYRILLIKQAKEEAMRAPLAALTERGVRTILDNVWSLARLGLTDLLAPALVGEYLAAFQAVNAGDVDMATLNKLARAYAEKVGDYFHQTSTQALLSGFNTYVNRRVPPKIAFDRMIEAYGLTPRQITAMVNLKEAAAVASNRPRVPDQQRRQYVAKSLSTRMRNISRQEDHTLRQTAKTLAWAWAQDKGLLHESARKIWITAKDERVCPVCGPLHGQRVPVDQPFLDEDGNKIYGPPHMMCRCDIRLLKPVSKIRKDLWDAVDEREHPRGNDGRWVKVRERDTSTIIETAPEGTESSQTPASKIGGSKIGGTSPTSKIGGPKIGAPKIEAKPALSRITQAITASLITAKIKADPPERIRARRDEQKIAAVMRAQDRIKPRYTGDIELSPVVSLPSPVYAAVFEHMFDGEDYLNLDDSVVFTDLETAQDHFYQEQDFVLEQNMRTIALAMSDQDVDGGFLAVPYNEHDLNIRPGEGRKIVGHMDVDSLSLIADAASDWQGNVSEPVEVEWWMYEYGEKSERLGTTLVDSWELFTRLDVEAEQAPEMLIVRLDTGWMDEESGQTTDQDHSGTKYGFESWHTRGRYKVVGDDDDAAVLIEPDLPE